MEEKYVGYLKYTGALVEEGLLDIKKSADALIGLDELLRYFLIKKEPTLKNVIFEIPVEIKKGSWEVLIPALQNALSPTGVITVASAIYLSKTAGKAAEEGFSSTGLAKDMGSMLRSSLISIQWVIRIASHVGGLGKKKLNVILQNKSLNDIFVQIPNDHGEYLSAPKEFFDLYNDCPEKLFQNNASLIEEGRTLEIGVYNDQRIQSVVISEDEKDIFYSGELESDDIVFPELTHGLHVELIGKITRGNEGSNTIGFRYADHVLTAEPEEGNIADFKERIVSHASTKIFSSVKIIGKIDRIDNEGGFKEKKPRIIFSDIQLVEEDDTPQVMF